MTSLGTIIGRGVTGSRPAAGTPGALYFDTTLSKLQRDNGSTWDDVEGAGGGSSTLAADTDVSVSSPANHDVLQYSTADSKWHNIPIGTKVEAALSSDSTTTSQNTYIDGPSVSLAAGTWLIVARITVLYTSAAAFIEAKLWDGTTTVDATEGTTGAANWELPLPLMGVVSPGTTTTYKVSAAVAATGGTLTIKAALANNSPGNVASRIVAVRIA